MNLEGNHRMRTSAPGLNSSKKQEVFVRECLLEDLQLQKPGFNSSGGTTRTLCMLKK